MLSVHSKKANKQPKNTKRKPVKVVYISNPMKVHTSAAEFRSLVQQLTGQRTNYPAITTTVGSSTSTNLNKYEKNGFYLAESPPASNHEVVHGDDNNYVLNNNNEGMMTDNSDISFLNNNNEGTLTDNSDISFEDYVGEDYLPELLENLPSYMWYD